MKRVFVLFIMVFAFILTGTQTFADDLLTTELTAEEKLNQSSIEVFPITAFFKVYSAQYLYPLTPKDHLIIGLAYVNPKVYNKQEEEIGQFFAPTLPIGYRRYLWKNLHVEYQLWPAFDFYYDKIGDKYYNGFDLYSEIRAGYKLDFNLGKLSAVINLQYVYGIPLYGGNKPDNFNKAAEEKEAFHAPAVAIGVRF